MQKQSSKIQKNPSGAGLLVTGEGRTSCFPEIKKHPVCTIEEHPIKPNDCRLKHPVTTIETSAGQGGWVGRSRKGFGESAPVSRAEAFIAVTAGDRGEEEDDEQSEAWRHVARTLSARSPARCSQQPPAERRSSSSAVPRYGCDLDIVRPTTDPFC